MSCDPMYTQTSKTRVCVVCWGLTCEHCDEVYARYDVNAQHVKLAVHLRGLRHAQLVILQAARQNIRRPAAQHDHFTITSRSHDVK